MAVTPTYGVNTTTLTTKATPNPAFSERRSFVRRREPTAVLSARAHHNRDETERIAIMTSRYLNDLLATTKVGHYEAPRLAELLEDADEPSAIFVRHFDQFSTDIERRFLQTIGIHKAILAISETLPHSDRGIVSAMRKDAAGLLRGCIKNYENMTETFFACDLRGLPCPSPPQSIRFRHPMIRRSSYSRWRPFRCFGSQFTTTTF
jgi:hypothetical protein